MEQKSFKSVLYFDSLPQFLNSFYTYKKALNPRFSYETWARSVGGLDRSYLRQISAGKRSLPASRVAGLLNYFRFRNEERQHFLDLVALCNRDTQKKALLNKVKDRVRYQKELYIIEEVEKFLSTPELPLLATLLSFNDVPKERDFLAGVLEVSPETFDGWMEVMLALGFVKKNAKGEWVNTRHSFRAPSSLGSEVLKRFHRLSLERAIKGLESPKESRCYEALMIPLTEDEYQDYLSLMADFRDRVLAQFNVHSLGERNLYQVNLAISPAFKQAPLGQGRSRKRAVLS